MSSANACLTPTFHGFSARHLASEVDEGTGIQTKQNKQAKSKWILTTNTAFILEGHVTCNL